MFAHGRRSLITLLLVLTLFTSTITGYVKPAQAAGPEINLDVKSAILVEASTGRIIYKLNEDIPLPPASMTKMMTELLVWEAIEDKKITWEQTVQTSDYGFYLAKIGDSSGVFLNEGEVRTVEELYKAMAIYSANDATVMLAETIAGSEENFVRMMNDKAKELGMNNTHFLTSTGFPADELGPYQPNIEGSHYMSARDAAILARELVTKHPQLLEISSVPRDVFRKGEENPIDMINWNWMLPGLGNEYEGVDGLKTGFTEEAKYCFTGTAERNGFRFISVVMGAESISSRFEETRKLLDYAFSNYRLNKLINNQEQVKDFENAPVKKGKQLEVAAVTKDALSVPVRIGEEDMYQVKISFDEVTAPLEKGDVVGTLTYEYSGQELNEFLRPDDQKNASVELVADQSVEKAGWIRLVFRGIKNFFGNIFSGIAETVKSWF